MTERIDALLNRLKAAPLDRDLARLEADVWTRIDGARRPDFFGRHAFQVQLAVSCGALLLGLAIAQFTGYSPMPRLNSEMVVLSDDSAMAPSVRLEGGI
ncbi:MAG TPA: hypothetical protein VHT51_19600 [Micropepsaceae bacterium]|jgi:hypothetical protein|nr:hypothetical protein [Micropepsaceae bacterium]